MPMLKRLLLKIYQGIFEYLLLLPFFFIFGILLMRESQLWSWLISLFGLFIIGLLFRMTFFKQKWWLFSLVSIVIGVSSAFVFDDRMWFVIILAMIHVIIVYRGMMYSSQTWEDLLPLSFLWVGSLGIYFVSYFIFRFAEILNPYLDYITMFGAILIVMVMFASNSDHLKRTTLSKKEKPFVSQTIKKHNRVFLTITIGLIALIANGKQIREGLWNGFRAVVKWLLDLISSGKTEEMIEEPAPAPSMDPALPFDEPKEPSAIAKLLEVITMYMVYFLLVIGVIILILLLIKKTRRWIINGFRLIIQFLKNIVSQMTELDESVQYVEEKESIFDWQEWKEEQQSRASGLIRNIFKRKPSWHALTNQQKVRYVFRNFVLNETNLKKLQEHHTPREILEELKSMTEVDEAQIEQLRNAYEHTRYGEQDVDEQIIVEIRSLIDRK